MSSSQRRGSMTAEGPAVSVQRRASVPQGAGATHTTAGRRGSKLNFLGAGRRVSMLLKYRQAFQSRRKSKVPEDEEEEEENPMAAIHQLPHSPRFSTFLSAEAQYAMMKGYEDKLYDKIAHSNPEVRSSLQRTKTPFQRISVVDQDVDQPLEEEEEEGKERGGESPDMRSTSSATSGHSTLKASTRISSLSPASTNTRSLDNRDVSPGSPALSTATMPYLRPLRRQSVDINGNGTMAPLENSLENMHLHRSYSLPTLDPPGGLSMNKRLVLTYRLESAMDLLDDLKQKNKENSLSPRVLCGQYRPQGDVVKNFNGWTQVWNKEFQGIHS